MIVKCAWCGKVLGEKPPIQDLTHTDGICDQCLLINFPDVYEKVTEIRDEETK